MASAQRLLAALGAGIARRGLAQSATHATVSQVASTTAPPRMSELFSTFEELDASSGVKDVTWEVLQERCEPGAGMGQTQGGWISDGTTIKEVLRNDWEMVQSLGTTHLELVAHLDAIYKKAKPCDFDHPKFEVEYDVQSLPGNTLPTAGPVQLKLSCFRTRGIQQDLLHPEQWGLGWNVEWTVSDGTRKLAIGGGDSSAGLLHYMKLFGFYEGGKDNEYRVSPAAIADLLTGGLATSNTTEAEADVHRSIHPETADAISEVEYRKALPVPPEWSGRLLLGTGFVCALLAMLRAAREGVLHPEGPRDASAVHSPLTPLE